MADATTALAAASHSRWRATFSASSHPHADLTFRSLSGKEPVPIEGVVPRSAAADGLWEVLDKELSAVAPDRFALAAPHLLARCALNCQLQ